LGGERGEARPLERAVLEESGRLALRRLVLVEVAVAEAALLRRGHAGRVARERVAVAARALEAEILAVLRLRGRGPGGRRPRTARREAGGDDDRHADEERGPDEPSFQKVHVARNLTVW